MASLSGKDILIIDDAADVRLLARKILEVDGAVVTEAESVDGGLEAAKTQVPHLVIIDLDIPGKNGFDFLGFRANDPIFRGIPALVLSGKKDRESVQRAFSLGADDYILKPFRATLLLQKIRKALRLSSFYSKKIAPGEVSAATFTVGAEVVALSEVGCVLESPVKFAPEENIRIKSDYFRELGAEDFRMRVAKTVSRYLDGGRYSTEVNFIGIDRGVAATLRTKIGRGK